MRGKGHVHGFLRGLPGITPAYAGKSRWLYAGNCEVKDHPRLCGEKGKSLLRAV